MGSWRRVAFIASAGAAALHVAAFGPHLAEYAPAGVFMACAGLAQLSWAVRVCRGAGDLVLAGGIVGHASIVGVWVVSRTSGLPFGPDAGMPEHVHAPDALATSLELIAIAAACALVLRFRRVHRTVVRLTTAGAALTVAVAGHAPVAERMVAAVVLVLSWSLIVGREHEGPNAHHRVRGYRVPARAGVGARG